MKALTRAMKNMCSSLGLASSELHHGSQDFEGPDAVSLSEFLPWQKTRRKLHIGCFRRKCQHSTRLKRQTRYMSSDKWTRLQHTA